MTSFLFFHPSSIYRVEARFEGDFPRNMQHNNLTSAYLRAAVENRDCFMAFHFFARARASDCGTLRDILFVEENDASNYYGKISILNDFFFYLFIFFSALVVVKWNEKRNGLIFVRNTFHEILRSFFSW